MVAVLGTFTVLEIAPRQEWLRRAHDLQVRAVVQAALASRRLEGAIKNGQLLWLQAALGNIARL